jgi:hypothetical protein
MIRSSKGHSRAGGNPALCPSRAGGNPNTLRTSLGSRLRGNDGWGGEEVVHRSPQEIMDEIAALDGESAEVLTTIRGLL